MRAWPGALDDLRDGVLRVLHERSFVDDPTRVWRVARYAARLGFTVEPQTARARRGGRARGASAASAWGTSCASRSPSPTPARSSSSSRR